MASLAVANSGERGALHLLERACKSFSEQKGFIRIFDGFFLKTKGFLPVYELFGSEMPLSGEQWRRHPTVSIWTHSNQVSGLSMHTVYSIKELLTITKL